MRITGSLVYVLDTSAGYTAALAKLRANPALTVTAVNSKTRTITASVSTTSNEDGTSILTL